MIDSSSSKHLTYFKVENFKCFNSLELDDIGLINIITGDNNIGKSSLLEALLYNQDIFDFNDDLGMILFDKGFTTLGKSGGSPPQYENNIKHFINNVSKKNELSFYFKIKGFGETLLKQEIKIHQNQLPENISHSSDFQTIFATDNSIITSKLNYSLNLDYLVAPYLSDQLLYEDLVEFYEDTLQKNLSLKTKFLEYLKEFVPGAVNIEIRTAKDEFKEPHLVIYTDKNSYPIPLNQFGQGTVKMLKIFMAIISFSGYRLMLDEIDNGIHFSRLQDYFKRIILLAKENNTQLFITTHSSECLKAIKKVFYFDELANDKDLFRCYSLNKTKNEEIKAYKYNFEEFNSSLDSDADIRGGF